MNFYVVDSVKGGCGKTTLALWKALELQKNPENEVCYIDLDLLGTSTEKHINQEKNRDSCYLNDLFINNRRDIQKKKVINSKCFSCSTDKSYRISSSADPDTINISMVFSSPAQDMKNKFRPTLPIYGDHIDYSFFARRIKELFDELYYGGFTDIVIDMPPNSDPYTDSIFDLLLNISIDEWKYDVDFHLFIISTYDRDHIESNKQWIEDLWQKDAKWKPLSSISWFFNDVRNSVNYENGVKKIDNVEISELVNQSTNEIQKFYQNIKLYSIAFNRILSQNSITGTGWEISLNISEI